MDAITPYVTPQSGLTSTLPELEPVGLRRIAGGHLSPAHEALLRILAAQAVRKYFGSTAPPVATPE